MEKKSINKIFLIFIMFITSILIWDVFNLSLSDLGLKLNLQKLDYSHLSVYFSAIITGLITWFAMWFISENEKQRWQKDSMQKEKNRLIIECNKTLADSQYFIKSERFQTLENNSVNSFDFKEYEKHFVIPYNNLSSLLVFYKKDSDAYNKINDLLNTLNIFVNIFDVIDQLITHDKTALVELLTQGIIFKEDNSYKVAIINYINFISQKEPNGVWLIDGRTYKFYKDFSDLYSDDFINLVNDLLEKTDSMREYLLEQCRL